MNRYQFFNEVLPQVTGGPTRMQSSGMAHCACPGAHLHKTRTASNHTTAYWNNGKPWINCYHESCSDVRLATSLAMRRQSYFVRGARYRLNSPPPHPKVDTLRRLAEIARVNKQAILDEYRWALSDIVRETRYPIDSLPAAQTVLHLSLFDPEDIIWIGEWRQSGKRWKKKFRTRDHWLSHVDSMSRFICPSTFNPGAFSRSGSNVACRKFLVVESDTLNKNQVGAVFRFLSQELTLRAVVDTGGKSLHAWYDAPAAGDMAELRALATPLGCDPKMFGASQPSRLAGRFRENGNLQRLIYLNPEISYVD